MAKFKIDVSKFKHLSTDDHTTTLQHPEGHIITIAHKSLSPDFKAQLEAMAPKASAKQSDKQLHGETKQAPAMMAKGGAPEDVPQYLSPNPSVDLSPYAPKVQDQAPAADNSSQMTALSADPNPPVVGTPPASSGGIGNNLLQTLGKVFPPANDPEQPMASNPAEPPPPASPNEPSPGLPQPANIGATYDKMNQALGDQAKAQETLAAQQVVAEKQRQDALRDQQYHDEWLMQQNKDHITDTINDVMSEKINPNQYLENMGTGQKIASAFGLILGGIGGALTHQENPAMKFLSNQIDRDIEAQKANLNKKNNVLAAYQHLYNDDVTAMQMAKATQYGIYASKLAQAAAQAQGPVARANATLAQQQLLQQKALYEQQAAIRQSLLKPNPTTGINENDPALYVPHVVPEPRQKEVYEQLQKAENIAQNSQKMHQAFDKAASFDIDKLIPGVDSPGQQALKQLMLPNFKQIDGTVRQAAMEESFRNLVPQFGDFPEKIAEKKQQLDNWMRSESAAPTARSFGLDPQKFRKTRFEAAPVGPQIKTVNGVKYMRGPNGQAVPVK